MKVVILAGGFGTRLSEETILKPKPMLEIGDKPIIWHIMKIYSNYGFKDFIICCGYRSEQIKQYFINFNYYSNDIKIDISKNEISVINKNQLEDWQITLVDTGLDSMTGGRLKAVSKYLKHDEDFCFTYGDGVSDINLTSLVKFHKKHKKMATMTVVNPPSRYGNVVLDSNNNITFFREKANGLDNWINAGFFILSPKVLKFIKNKKTIWEVDPIKNLVKLKELRAFKHRGFWHSMDTQRDKDSLNNLWSQNKAPWKTWDK